MPTEDSLNIKIIYDNGRFSSDFITALYSKFCSILLHFKDNLNQKVFQLENSLEKLSIASETFPLWYDQIIEKTALSKNHISSSANNEKIDYVISKKIKYFHSYSINNLNFYMIRLILVDM
jgi:hypothetical protein